MHQPKPSEVAKAALARIHAEADAASAKSLRAFLDKCVADIPPEPKQYGLIEEPWQRERNARIIPAAEFIAGLNPNYKGVTSFWEGWQKSCDKSSTIARYCCWWLKYSKRPLKIYIGAKDVEQGTVIYEFMEKTAKLNQAWLGKHLDFTRNRVTGPSGSVVKVLASDATGLSGITPDVVICDEISVWSNLAFWKELNAATGKRAGKDPVTGQIKSFCLLFVITNAGFVGSWAWDLRNYAASSPQWSFYEQPPNTIAPSWLSPEIIADKSRAMPPWEARRLWWNNWVNPSETGEKFFESSDIDACVGSPKEAPNGAKVYLGIDYGEKRDRTALSVVWMDDQGVIHVPEITVWQGTPDNTVKLTDIEQWLNLQWGRYPNAIPVFDPHQTLYLIQKCEAEGRDFRRFEFRSGKNNLLMADNLRFLFKQRRICLSLFTGIIGGSTVVDELKDLVGEQKSYGIRMQHTRHSNDDRSVSLGMAALCAVQEQSAPVAEQIVRPPSAEEQWAKMQQPKHQWDRNWAARRGLFGMQQ